MDSIYLILMLYSFYLPVNPAESDTNENSVSQQSDDEMNPQCANKSHIPCENMSNQCLSCPTYTTNCTYGEWMTVECFDNHNTCNINQTDQHEHSRTVKKLARCIFCYQTEPWEQKCTMSNMDNCLPLKEFYKTANCTVHNEVMCLGHRNFEKKIPCNHTKGHKWSTAMLLSITLGGFGVDRFYLGHWQEGIGKLFSFGGLGVWTLVDALLIAIRYLGPADGSFYV